MAMRRHSSSVKAPRDIAPIIRLWLLRILVPLGAHRKFITARGFDNETLAETLGLSEWIDPVPCDFEPKAVRAELRKQHHLSERKFGDVQVPSCLRSNVARLSELVGLSDTDCRILEFAVLVQSERILDDTADWLGDLSSQKVFNTLSVLLDLSESEIRSSLSAKAILAKSGLVSVDRSGSKQLRRKLDLLSDNFADHISSSETDPVNLLRDTVTISSPAELEIADYPQIAPSLSVLRPYLKRSIVTGRKGVNIFLHGDPGTGKSQLAKALAKDLDCELFEVASEDGDGDPVNGERRLRAFRAAQSFLSQRRAIILFDEVEDVFNDGDDLF
ncbi:MAG: AAA family ATPase, partial [Sideroxyarcus sp.]|nr:AAA family ATPase [Sideroxyarcus sp.]